MDTIEIIIYSALGLSTILNIVLFYRGYKLVEQIESYQQRYLEMEEYATKTFVKMLEQMKQIDIRGSFEADDEVGSVFKELKQTIEQFKKNF